MYEIVRIERINDTVFRDTFNYADIDEAKAVYEKEKLKPIRILQCVNENDKIEVCRFVRHTKKEKK